MSWSNLIDKLRTAWDIIMTSACIYLTYTLLWEAYVDFDRYAPGFALTVFLLIVGSGAILGIKDLRKP